jgi:hypothetical protein
MMPVMQALYVPGEVEKRRLYTIGREYVENIVHDLCGKPHAPKTGTCKI